MSVTAMNIQVDIPQIKGAPFMNMTELKDKVQAYVNALYIHIAPTKEGSATQKHSLSSLKGICTSGITDEQAINEYLSDKYDEDIR